MGRNKGKKGGSFLFYPEFFNLTQAAQPRSTPTTRKGKFDTFTRIGGTCPGGLACFGLTLSLLASEILGLQPGPQCLVAFDFGYLAANAEIKVKVRTLSFLPFNW